jgi:uncharacterized protein
MSSRRLSEKWATSCWLNTPQEWSVEHEDTLYAVSGDRTDFWQTTFYGFQRDDGHALLRPVEGEFTAELTFQGQYEQLYDQAGLMMRLGPMEWIKFGVEWTDGSAHLSVVVTRNGLSDWSAQPIVVDGPQTIRATRLGSAILLQRWDGKHWLMARLAPCPGGTDAVSVGPYLCSPQRANFSARFLAFDIGPPRVRQLHA